MISYKYESRCQVNLTNRSFSSNHGILNSKLTKLSVILGANSIGGCFTWDVTFNDFNNYKCGLGNFSLLNAAMNILSGTSTSNTTTTTKRTLKENYKF